MKTETERNLVGCYIKALREDSYEAFNIIYEMYVDQLYGYFLMHTKSQQLSEDLVQEVFIKLWNNRKNLKEIGSLKSMLFIIGRNLMIDTFRTQLNNVELDQYVEYIEENLYDPETERIVPFDEYVNALESGKKSLTDRQLQIFEMSKEEGKSNLEIAESLQLSEQTVKNTLSASLKKIRSYLPRAFFLL